MKLALIDMKTKVCNEDVFKDDALEIWLEIKNENKHLAAPAAFFAINRKQTMYYEINFVDEDGGELSFLNCSIMLHNMMIKYKLYPQFILNGLNRNYNDNRAV